MDKGNLFAVVLVATLVGRIVVPLIARTVGPTVPLLGTLRA